MPTLVAFASLPFGVAAGTYDVNTPLGREQIHISEATFTPFLSIASHPELVKRLPENGIGDGITSYTWYDHPFVLRVVFARNVAALGSANSNATVVRQFDDQDMDSEATDNLRCDFVDESLAALNNLIAVVRGKAHLYHIFDLRREDIDVTIRDSAGQVLVDDPLQDELIKKEEEQTERFDLSAKGERWYAELRRGLTREEPVGLADDLLIEAERALSERFPRQAIATCHSTIEAAVSVLLTHGMTRRGLGDEEIDYTLTTRSLTSKLEALLRKYTGFSLKKDNRALWQQFNRLNDLRNDIVHRGLRPTNVDGEFAIRVTRNVLRWLKMVRSRNH